jgi:hypothetical protein
VFEYITATDADINNKSSSSRELVAKIKSNLRRSLEGGNKKGRKRRGHSGLDTCSRIEEEFQFLCKLVSAGGDMLAMFKLSRWQSLPKRYICAWGKSQSQPTSRQGQKEKNKKRKRERER